MADENLAESDPPELAEEPGDNDDALRKRLLSRIAMAAVAILGLLGGLAVFDTLNRPQERAEPKMAVTAVASEKTEKEVAVATAPQADENKTEESESKLAEAKTVPEAEPEHTETPVALAPNASAVPPAKPVTQPAVLSRASIKPSAGSTKPVVEVTPEDTQPAKQAVMASHAPLARPLTRVMESVNRFLLQVGVFGNYANAEELLGKLQAAGIPARIESHVQVGPFATRAEADAAREKLKSLGLDDGLLVRR